MGEKKLLLSRSEFWMNSVTVSLRCKSFCDVDLFCQLTGNGCDYHFNEHLELQESFCISQK